MSEDDSSNINNTKVVHDIEKLLNDTLKHIDGLNKPTTVPKQILSEEEEMRLLKTLDNMVAENIQFEDYAKDLINKFSSPKSK